jgi:predicted nucleic acid-binding protein
MLETSHRGETLFMTEPRFLLDTNILSEPTKLQPNSAVMRKLEWHYRSIATASVVLHELFIWLLSFTCAKAKTELRRVHRFTAAKVSHYSCLRC